MAGNQGSVCFRKFAIDNNHCRVEFIWVEWHLFVCPRGGSPDEGSVGGGGGVPMYPFPVTNNCWLTETCNWITATCNWITATWSNFVLMNWKDPPQLNNNSLIRCTALLPITMPWRWMNEWEIVSHAQVMKGWSSPNSITFNSFTNHWIPLDQHELPTLQHLTPVTPIFLSQLWTPLSFSPSHTAKALKGGNSLQQNGKTASGAHRWHGTHAEEQVASTRWHVWLCMTAGDKTTLQNI